MRALSITALITLSSLAGLTYAQGVPIQITRPGVPMLLFDEKACYLPDSSSHPVNTVTTFQGQRYRCVEVFGPALHRSGQSGALEMRVGRMGQSAAG